MSQNSAPSLPQEKFQSTDLNTGRWTSYGVQTLEQMWRQVAAGFVNVPCNAVTAANVITLTPILHQEGGRTYGNYMGFTFVADVTTSAPVTALVQGEKALATIKVYKSDGAAQADNGDIVQNCLYTFYYNSALDTGAGGFVKK